MLRSFGATKVSILNGSWKKWLKEGQSTEGDQTEIKDTAFTKEGLRKQSSNADDYHYELNRAKYATFEDIQQNIASSSPDKPVMLDSRFANIYNAGHVT